MFKPIDWPEVCYVQEAVYWIALGRVPEFYHDEHGDARNGEEALQTGELVGDFDWAFSELEFAWAGVVDLDYNRYLDSPRVLNHLGEVAHSSSAYLSKWEETYRSLASEKGDDDDDGYARQIIERVRVEAVNYDWRQQLEAVFVPHIELARAEIFRFLVKGELLSYGLREISEEEDFQIARIEPRDWRLSFDWTRSALQVGTQELKCVHVKTDDLLKLFPKPLCEPAYTSVVEVYPGVAILSEGPEILHAAEVATRGRGRPKIGGGFAESAVKNWIKSRLNDPDVPMKREALIYEAMEFSAKILGHKVQRTTIQDWLKDILPPKNISKSAGNSAEVHAVK